MRDHNRAVIDELDDRNGTRADDVHSIPGIIFPENDLTGFKVYQFG